MKQLLIVGGGHSALPLLKMGNRWKERGVEIMLVNPNPYLVYSGALPQYMAGFYDWEQTAVDLEQLCSRYDVAFIQDRVVEIDAQSARIQTERGQQIPFNALLVDVGVETEPIVNASAVMPVKPMSALLDLKEMLLGKKADSLLIAGGGAAGTELALNLSNRMDELSLSITLMEAGERLLPGFPSTLAVRAAEALKKRGVQVHTSAPVEERDVAAHTYTILATGNRPATNHINHPFETDETGRILTDAYLRVQGHPAIFAAGDAANVDGQAHTQIGVHAVKQGVTLRQNIAALLFDELPAEAYKPYLTQPLILSDGPEYAHYVIGNKVFSGRFFAVLKYILDSRWLEKYNRVPEHRRSDWQLFKDGWKRSRKAG
ncbi:MAG: NAD(P)/FAD-dependent oxidoreductase [Balneolaceae bacterium]